jgi:membrane associated rhomboid family serine protease
MRRYSILENRSFISNFSFNTILIGLNVIFFVLFTILISTNLISISDVAINPGNILKGLFLWTFLTSMFMHAGFFHLFVNMLSLLFVGSLIEKILGKRRYILFYLFSGIFAGLFFVLSALFFPSEMSSFAVGASGALFALVGLLAILTPNLRVYMMFVPIPIKMKYAAPGFLVVLWLISLAGNVPIGNFAHLGGLIAGLVYGFYLKKKFPRRTKFISKRFS